MMNGPAGHTEQQLDAHCNECAEYLRMYGGGVCEKHSPPGTIRIKMQVQRINPDLMNRLFP